METITVTSKHQITIPVNVRRSLNLHKGDRLAFESGSDGAFRIRKVTEKKSDGAAVPYIKKGHNAFSRDEIATAIGKGAVASWKQRQS